MEIPPTNHVLEEIGSDIQVNIYEPNSKQIFGDEENQFSVGINKPKIVIMCLGAHYELLHLQDE